MESVGSVLDSVRRTTDRRRALFMEMGGIPLGRLDDAFARSQGTLPASNKMLLEPFCDRVAGKVLAELMGLLDMTASDLFQPGAILIPGQVS